MTSIAEVVNAVREDYLLAGSQPQLTRLTSAHTAGGGSLVVEDASGIGTGTRISIDYEEFHVWSKASNTLTVSGAHAGSTAADHANGSIVTISPEYSDAKILRSVQQVCEQLRHDTRLYRISHTDFDPPHTSEFNLGPAPDSTDEDATSGVLEVLIATEDAEEPWVRSRPIDVIQRGDADGSDAIVIIPEIAHYGEKVRIVKRTPLGTVTAATADVEADVGILNTDLLAVGAAVRLGAGRAIRRTSLHAQGDARRANEVAAFSTGNATRGLESRYKQLLEAEVIRLKRQYPYRKMNR